MKIPVPASEQAQQSQSAPQASSLIAKAESTFEDARPEAMALQRAQNMAGDNPHHALLKSRQAMMAASPVVQQLKSIQNMMVNKTLAATQHRFMALAETPVQKMQHDEPHQGKTESKPAQLEAAAQAPRPNNTGLPDNLKSGMENLSGMNLDHVKVHYNSDKPAQLQAHAYAQGSEIHVAPGQEKHLPHEAWHVVQQAQGRVKPTLQMKAGIPVNDDAGLEQEADAMGEKALSMATVSAPAASGTQASLTNNVVQNYFTAKGDKAKKLRQWISATKKALADNGENRLLEFFNENLKSGDKIEWDNVREPYAMTRLKLRQMLDGETDAPLTLMDDEYPTEKLAGAKSAAGHNRLAAWDIQDRGVLDPRSHTELAHVSKKADWMSARIDTTHGADKGELGQGFYTVSGHSDAPAEGIRNEFGEDGKEPRDVLKFRIANVEIIKMVGGDPGLGAFLVFVLQNPSGYPDRADVMGSINAINKLGMALIFPDKTTKVDIDNSGTKHSYETYREINGGAGSHSLIIGPQARESLDGIRQICARGYLGDKIINEAPRSEKRMGPRPPRPKKK